MPSPILNEFEAKKQNFVLQSKLPKLINPDLYADSYISKKMEKKQD